MTKIKDETSDACVVKIYEIQQTKNEILKIYGRGSLTRNDHGNVVDEPIL
jgi:hypothetical protein